MFVVEKAHVQHHGLLNQGATCYLNSVLQVLFMTRDFRAAVERHTRWHPGTEYIDHQLKDLFDDLQQRTAKTSKIKGTLGINDKEHEQLDAAENFEKILNLTSPEASRIFQGELTHKTTCSECLTEKDTNGQFWHLPLELMDSHRRQFSVVEGMEEYFSTSHFNGENQMYCEKCDSKSDATLECRMKHHPEVLALLLKRFDFNYSDMKHVKNDCAVNVPFTLQIPENQMYELYAIVEHVGDLRSGHYTATIKAQDDERWYNFNDSTVTLLDYQPFQVDNTEKSHSAYLLFYTKKTHAQDIRKVATIEGRCPGGGGHAVNIKSRLLHDSDADAKPHERVDGELKMDDNEWRAKCLSKAAQREKRVDNQHYNHGRQKTGNRYASIEKNRMADSDEEYGRKRRKSSTKNPDRNAKPQNNQGLESGGVKDGKEEQTRVIKRRHSTRGGYYCHESQDRYMSTSHSWSNRGGSERLHKRPEHRREEWRDVKGGREQERGDNEHAAHSRRTSDRLRRYGLDVDDRNNFGFAGDRRSRSQHNMSVPIRRDSSERRGGSAERGRMTNSEEEIRPVNSQARTACKEVTVEVIQTKHTISDRRDKTETLVENRGGFKRKSDPKGNETDSLSKRFCGLNLDVPKPQRNSQEVNEAGVVPYSRGTSTVEKLGSCNKKSKWWCLNVRVKKSRKRRNTGCLPFFKRKRTKAKRR